jgi:hypothetical protein
MADQFDAEKCGGLIETLKQASENPRKGSSWGTTGEISWVGVPIDDLKQLLADFDLLLGFYRKAESEAEAEYYASKERQEREYD